ncbi:hypothetical protein XaplCFBP3123_02650 [Xanthomonas arboricola pv. populi]|nr:hypothetical protein XaplCFBP3123_02650 [Xanthomonas arboricola pv. populi]
MQLSFGDAEYNSKRKPTRREVFLAEMDPVVSWEDLLALLAPHYPKSGQPGRQPYPLETMLRIHFLQQWYALSDPSAEEALYDTVSMRRAAKIGGVDKVPDETTILNFRHLLKQHDLARKLFNRVNAHLSRKGQSLRSGTIVDATIIARYRGLAKNTAQGVTLFAQSNLWLKRKQLMPVAGRCACNPDKYPGNAPETEKNRGSERRQLGRCGLPHPSTALIRSF